MLQLPNGCRCSEPAVFPKNWKTKNASLKKPWTISYRFYDPSHARPKQVSIRGMNKYKELAQRQEATQSLLDHELELLINQAYNPIKGSTTLMVKSEIDPFMPWPAALTAALAKIKAVRGTTNDMRSVIYGVTKAAVALHIHHMPVKEVSRRHIKTVLDHCEANRKRWSPRRYNLYRAYLMRLFKELVELEAIEINPVRDISTQRQEKKIRATTTPADRKRIDKHLKKNHYHFWRFVQIFFHSGAREAELMKLRVSDVDMPGQRYKILIRKGKGERWVWKTIKDSVVKLWREVLGECEADQVLFSKYLKPGEKPIRSDQLSRRWRKYVKEDLGIDADLYSLKHTNAEAVVDALDDQAAAQLMSHTSTAMVVNIYDTGRAARQHNKLKQVKNKF